MTHYSKKKKKLMHGLTIKINRKIQFSLTFHDVALLFYEVQR
jgi:hypothetical protein